MSTTVNPNSKQSNRRLPAVLQQVDGPMTRELLLSPGKHGLGMTPDGLEAEATTVSVCGYCSTGCGLRIHLRDEAAVGLTPSTEYPVNLGMACPKGWEALRVLESDDRADRPLLRDASGKLQATSWDTALRTFCDRFKSIQKEHGKESVAFLSTGQIACEEMAFLGALAKFGMGIRHGDGNTRQCMATAVAAYKESFGFDAPPYTYEDFEESDCLVFIGANPCLGHPIMWERVLRNPHQPEILVVDPRRTETAAAATQHLPLKPKSDLVLLYAITRELIASGQIDQSYVDAHTSGFETLKESVEEYTLEIGSAASGLSEEQIRRFANTIGRAKRASFWWTMGVNQSYEGVRTAQAIINISLITGNMGRPGTGANSITGQCNAMGSRLWSNTTNLLGHRRFENEADRHDVAEILGIDVAHIPTQGSWAYDEIIDGIERGDIKGLWVIATNPAHSWIHQNQFQEILEKLEFLVVQDMYHSTETAERADLVLPAAGWGEKEGTFINSERRYGVHRRVRPAPGEALSDFRILRAIAEYWGVGEMFREWTDPPAVFGILQRLSADRPCDITGIEGYRDLDSNGGIQWPWSKEDQQSHGSPETHRRLFEDGKFFTSDGRARLIVDSPRGMPEQTDDSYPMLLMTGRGSASQWHTQTRTSKSPILRKLYPSRLQVELHREDARALDMDEGETVRVVSRRGETVADVKLTNTVSLGNVFMAMHEEGTNRLTLPHFDPQSRQPSYKDCAVRIEKIVHETGH